MIHSVIATRPSPLLRALRRSAQAAGVAAVPISESDQPWATATFAGALCRLALDPDPSPAFAAWLASLPDADLDMRDGIVIDLVVEAPATIVALVMQIDTPAG